MVKISSNNTIRMTKGDTLRTKVLLTDLEGNEYVPEPGDRIRFAMKRAYSDEEVLVLKDIPIDNLILTLRPEDTKTLDAPAPYVYDIEMTYANGDVDTFIAKAKLMLTEEVY